jgi:hypothetical protein
MKIGIGLKRSLHIACPESLMQMWLRAAVIGVAQDEIRMAK